MRRLETREVLNCKARVQKDTRQNSLVLLRDCKAEQATEKARKLPSTKSWEMPRWPGEAPHRSRSKGRHPLVWRTDQ